MANVFQKIFLSRKKIIEIDRHNEIMQLITSNPIAHHSYMTKSGMVVRRFSIKTDNCHLYTERFCDLRAPKDQQVQYTLRIDVPKNINFATHSAIDKFTERAYMKMYKLWNKNRQHVK